MAPTKLITDVAVRAVNLAVHILNSAASLTTRIASLLWARRGSLKHWHVWAAIVTIFSLSFAILAFWTSLDAARYARWTARKDFILICADETTRQLSRACAGASNASLPAPPGFHNYLARRDGRFDSNLDALPEAQRYLYTGWREASAFGKAFRTRNCDFWSSSAAFGPIVNMACTSLRKDFPDAEQRILPRGHDRCAGQNHYLLATLIMVVAHYAPAAAVLARHHYRMWPMGHVAERTRWTHRVIHRVGQALLQEFGTVLVESSTCPDKQKATLLQVRDLILQYGAVSVILRVVTTMIARYVTRRLLRLALASLFDPCLRLYNRSIRGPLRSQIRYIVDELWQGSWFILFYSVSGLFLILPLVILDSNDASKPVTWYLAVSIAQSIPEPRHHCTLDIASPERCTTCGRENMELQLVSAEPWRNKSELLEEGTCTKSFVSCESCEILSKLDDIKFTITVNLLALETIVSIIIVG